MLIENGESSISGALAALMGLFQGGQSATPVICLFLALPDNSQPAHALLEALTLCRGAPLPDHNSHRHAHRSHATLAHPAAQCLGGGSMFPGELHLGSCIRAAECSAQQFQSLLLSGSHVELAEISALLCVNCHSEFAPSICLTREATLALVLPR